MERSTPIPTTQNVAWGFFGTMNEEANVAWPLAMTAISNATGQPLEYIRSFLDSRYGRRFADELRGNQLTGLTLEAAIEATTKSWMKRTIGRITSVQRGIPYGLPELIGYVVYCETIDS
ncbi:hypothetical protein O5O45_31780 [Hahella aquimaris]|uniref:hypothetical protein n=1 Tax=Hahella sp. HNIBRBA332 TaxID=3015983 RepID=UPI00273CA396|nr:hypothetical protein [Hahella sp. HNIBRBA332]WLQ14300.1 hypothetical protein O5O45_31780 [Hahella sp. HNIBRBA332]